METSGLSSPGNHGNTYSQATLRSYKSWSDRFAKSNRSSSDFLSGLSSSSFRQAKAALSAAGIPLGDLSGIPKATAHERIVDVPPDDMAKKMVESIPGISGEVLRLVYDKAERLNDVLRRPEFKGRVRDVTIQRNLKAACKKLRLRRHYTVNSIKFAGARKIATTQGFLAAYEALKCQTVKRARLILGKKCLENLSA